MISQLTCQELVASMFVQVNFIGYCLSYRSCMWGFFRLKIIVVAGDVRLTSEELKNTVTNGLLNSGVNVIDFGETGTEEVYFATSF